MKLLLKNAHLVIDGNREYLNGALLINDDIIEDVFDQSNKIKEEFPDYKSIDLNGSIIMPGFFDTHCHGIKMMCFDDCAYEELSEISKEFVKDGTTSYLASLSYDLEIEDYYKRLELLDKYNDEICRFEGIHLEGPFLSPLHLGMADPNKLKEVDLDVVKKFLNITNKIKQMTIAYELDGAKQIGKLLHENNIRVMCGHSNALIDDLDDNVDGFTHLFNAMRGLHHRDITLVNGAFLNKWYVEIIGDGNHIDKNVLKLIIKNIDRNLIMLVSDSSIARNLADGEYTFISKACTKKGTKFISHDGHYAGSCVSINDEMKVLYELGVDYCDLLLYSSLNAFKFYGLDKRFGSLEKGKYADIVIMDDDLNVKDVYVRGRFVND